jgi:hypothetical protein
MYQISAYKFVIYYSSQMQHETTKPVNLLVTVTANHIHSPCYPHPKQQVYFQSLTN